MLGKVLLYIKHQWPQVWSVIDLFHDGLFRLLYQNRAAVIAKTNLTRINSEELRFSMLKEYDADALVQFFNAQDNDQLKYFQPHGFSIKSIKWQIRKRSFIAMAVWAHEKIIGYFFLRLFLHKICFVGRIVDKEYQRRGIAKRMSEVMYGIASDLSFKCMTTISRHNDRIIDLHRKEENLHIVGELPGDYWLVEIRNP